MNALFNYHTHTTFCDGADSAEDNVLEAIRLGLSTLGFSSHAPMMWNESYCMHDTRAYRDEIYRLADRYSDKIKILCGVERDIYSSDDDFDYDFVIGAAHYIYRRGKYVCVDYTRESLVRAVTELWDGDGEAMAADYMRTSADIARLTDCDIVAHIDLVTKFNGDGRLFDAEGDRYLASARAAVDALVPSGALFEINTGAMSRGYRKEPYPSHAILKMIHDAGGSVTYGADSHRASALLYCRDDAERLAQECGFDGFTRLPCDR